MSPPKAPYRPYASAHVHPSGPGDARPTAQEVVEDCGAIGKLTDKSILLTGPTSGIGIATAEALYSTGAQLWLTGRDEAKLEQVIDRIVASSASEVFPRPRAIEMRLDSFASIRAGAAQLKAKTDVPYSKTVDGFESHFAVNHLSHFLLFHELRPLLSNAAKASGTTSRVVCVSSSGHRFSGIRFEDLNFETEAYDMEAAYGQSKTASIYMANTLTRLYGSDGITGLSLHPGVIITTDVYRYMSKEMTEDLDSKRDPRQVKTAEQGSATTVWAAISPYFEDVNNGGRYLSDVGECGPMNERMKGVAGVTGYASFAYDEEKADRLWKVSCDAIGASFDDGSETRA